MKIKYFYFQLVLALAYVSFATAQINYNKLPVYIPASPNAAELSKYGNLDVGFQTGSLNFKIPLFNVEGNQWSMPIDIQYFTTGIKVDQIESRVGMGWALNAGGVITRNVNHQPDESATRSVNPTNWSNYDQAAFDYLNNISINTSLDSEPDDFYYNFNGFSGKFVFDNNGKPISIPHSNLKIKFILNNNHTSSFTITTPDGSIYSFEDMEYTVVTSLGSGFAAQQVFPRVASAWYLSRIQLPNKDEVRFIYQYISHYFYTGISQTIIRSDDIKNNSLYPGNCPECAVVNRVDDRFSSVDITGVRLSKLIFKEFTADFEYIARTVPGIPPSDTQSDELLSRITLKAGGKILRSLNFTYEYGISDAYYELPFFNSKELRYRAYLKTFYQLGANSEEQGRHRFYYHDINGMPPRLSYSQDMNGYFNRKHNLSFIPKPELSADQLLFPQATADRSVDLEGSLKGSLVKIIYPGGGSDSLSYELNSQFVTKKLNKRENVSVSIPASNTAVPLTNTSIPFSTSNISNVVIKASMLIKMGSDGSSPYNPLTDLLLVQVHRQSDNLLIFSEVLKAGQAIDQLLPQVSMDIPHVLTITCYVPNLRCNASVAYDGQYYAVDGNESVPGLRVAKLLSKAEPTSIPVIKKYYYVFTSDLSKSSGKTSLIKPILFKPSSSYVTGSCSNGEYGGLSFRKCWNNIAYSSSLVNLFPYSQNHVYYENVVEGIGEAFEGGGVSHTYWVKQDVPSRPIISEFQSVFGLKLTNSGFLNGKEKEQLVFKKVNGQFVNVKRISNSYKVDTTVHHSIDAYIHIKNYEYPINHNPVWFIEFEGFDIHKYKVYSPWIYRDTTTVYDYMDGGRILVSKTAYKYANPLHTQQTKVTMIGSDAKVIETNFTYPHEKILAGQDPAGIYQSMVNDHVIQPVVELQRLKSNIQTDLIKINYIQPFPHLFYPGHVQVQSDADSKLETRIRYHQYDRSGNALSMSYEQGSKSCYVWAYGKSKPVAEIKNAEYAIVEAVLGGADAVDLFCSNYIISDNDLRDFLAPLRTDLRLKDAQVSTYTYDPLVGMTSQTDAKGMSTFYNYDGFQRLKHIQDQNSNIIKSYNYHYKP